MKRTPLNRGTKKLARKTPLRPFGRRGSALRQQTRAFVMDRSNGWCEARISGVCEGRATQMHHRLMRSQGGPDVPENCIAVDPACHRWIHDHPAESYRQGWLLRRLAS